MHWFIIAIVAFTGLAALVCWVLMHIELTRTKRSVHLLRAEMAAWQSRWESEWPSRVPAAPPPAPAAPATMERELNFALRSEIMRQAKAGRNPAEIASRLGVPAAQVKLIFKVYERLSAQAARTRPASPPTWEQQLQDAGGHPIADR
jgi:hypothetical protein